MPGTGSGASTEGRTGGASEIDYLVGIDGAAALSLPALIILAPFAGLVMGTLYFGGLWLTLQHLMTTRRPALLTVGSYFGRLAACFLGFYLVAVTSGVPGMLICLAAFTAARAVMLHLGKRVQP